MIQFLNGLQLAMLLFLLSVGLSIVLGLMNFINLAHGSFAMAGCIRHASYCVNDNRRSLVGAPDR